MLWLSDDDCETVSFSGLSVMSNDSRVYTKSRKGAKEPKVKDQFTIDVWSIFCHDRGRTEVLISAAGRWPHCDIELGLRHGISKCQCQWTTLLVRIFQDGWNDLLEPDSLCSNDSFQPGQPWSNLSPSYHIIFVPLINSHASWAFSDRIIYCDSIQSKTWRLSLHKTLSLSNLPRGITRAPTSGTLE